MDEADLIFNTACRIQQCTGYHNDRNIAPDAMLITTITGCHSDLNSTDIALIAIIAGYHNDRKTGRYVALIATFTPRCNDCNTAQVSR